MNQLSRIAAISDAEAARLVSAGTLADLAGRIMSAPQRETPASRRRPRLRRSWLIGFPVAAGLAVLLLIATSLGHPGQQAGPVNIGPARAEAAALSFTRQGRYIDVIVRNPVADPGIYRAEFAAHHLHITLRLVPVSPSLIGTVVYIGASTGGGITTITAKGRCWTGGGGNVCPVGVRVPTGFRGSADFVFGRAARPGEQYESTGPVTGPGEAMHGLRYLGRPVATVLAMLRARQVTVPVYRYTSRINGIPCQSLRPGSVPATWLVYQADPWAPHQVALGVGPKPGAQGPGCSIAQHGTAPTPSPAPSSRQG
jgi:hypothetical protein